MSPETKNGKDVLLGLDVPELHQAQLDLFTKERLLVKPPITFDPELTKEKMRRRDGDAVFAVDIGGDRLTFAEYAVRHDGLKILKVKVWQGDQGKGYLQILEKVARDAITDGIDVGISCAGPVSGTKPDFSPNLQTLREEFNRYDGDFLQLFRKGVALQNDAVAGAMSSVFEAFKRDSKQRNTIYIINGSGLGGAVFKDGYIFAAEPGHIEIVKGLNPERQNATCNMHDDRFTCLESVGASKAGVEDLWFQKTEEMIDKKTGKMIDGREISRRYQEGDDLALRLYANSALITAHAIYGLGSVFELFDRENPPVVVCHGGTFYVPGYGERVDQILEKALGYKLDILFTKNFERPEFVEKPNPGLDGAAIAALYF